MVRSASAAALPVALFAGSLLPAAPASAAPGARCGHVGTAPARLTLADMRRAEFCLINRVRGHFHLHRLHFNVDLRKSAIGHSDSMVHHHYFAHEGPGGSMGSRITRAGYLARVRAYTLGENIGGGRGRRFGSPWSVFKEWMHSPPHRANILDPSFRDAGVGVARGYPNRGGGNSATYTVDFGARSGG